MRRLPAAVALAVAMGSWLAAQAAAQEPLVRVPYVETAPPLDAFLGVAPPPEVLRLDDFRQRRPGDGTPGSQTTTAYLFRTHASLFVVFVCRDREPTKIRARLTRREAPVQDDLVGLMLDTFHDRRRAYVFLANARGVQRDAVLTEGQGEDYSFDTIWRTDGRLLRDGYAVLLEIPFRSLRFAGGASDTWGVGLTRRIPRTSEELYWPLVSQRTDAIVPQLAPVGGFSDASPGRNIQVIPFSTFTDAQVRSTPGGSLLPTREGEAGVDGKVVLADRVTIDVTVNPDFSQVESDDPQVTINQRYEVYFPEKRPFFLESAGLFQTPESLFFSRRVVSPEWGTRLTGKLGRWNIGTLFASDRTSDTSHHEPRANVGVIRVQREIGRESSAGVLLTTREAPGGTQHVAAADARMRLSPSWTFQGQASQSLQGAGADAHGTGTATLAELIGISRHWTFVNKYLDRSAGFVAPLGFIQRTDIRQAVQITNYRWRPTSGPLLAYGPGLATSMTWAYEGGVLDQSLSPHFGLEFRGATQVLLTGFLNKETFQGTEFDVRTAQLQVNSSWLGWLDLSGFYQRGERLNYAPAAGLRPFVGNTRDVFVRAAVRPTPRVAFEQTYILAALRMSGATAEATRVFSNHLSRSKVSLQLTRALSLRAILDYGHTHGNQELTVIGSARWVTGDALVTYQINPFTAIYAGYTSVFDDAGRHPTSRDTLWNVLPLDPASRQGFAKISYGFRF